MGVLRKAVIVFEYVTKTLSVLSILVILYAWIIICTEVILRYFFNRPPLWALETTEYGLLLITFFGAAHVLQEDGHVTVDLLVNRFSPSNQAFIGIITSILGAVICFALFWYGIASALDAFRVGSRTVAPLQVPKGLLLAIIPIGSFLLFIQFLRRTYGYWCSWRNHMSERG